MLQEGRFTVTGVTSYDDQLILEVSDVLQEFVIQLCLGVSLLVQDALMSTGAGSTISVNTLAVKGVDIGNDVICQDRCLGRIRFLFDAIRTNCLKGIRHFFGGAEALGLVGDDRLHDEVRKGIGNLIVVFPDVSGSLVKLGMHTAARPRVSVRDQLI